jgi:hypothetical protein
MIRVAVIGLGKQNQVGAKVSMSELDQHVGRIHIQAVSDYQGTIRVGEDGEHRIEHGCLLSGPMKT